MYSYIRFRRFRVLYVPRSIGWARARAVGGLETQLLLLRLDPVALRPPSSPILGLYLGSLGAQALVDLGLEIVAVAGSFVHEAL